MELLSDDWLAAMDRAARARPVPQDDPLSDVLLRIEQVVDGGPTWRLVIDHGRLHVETGTDHATPADVRFLTDRATSMAIARGERAALDAFITGDLRIGGDVQALLAHRTALETLGDLFASVAAEVS